MRVGCGDLWIISILLDEQSENTKYRWSFSLNGLVERDNYTTWKNDRLLWIEVNLKSQEYKNTLSKPKKFCYIRFILNQVTILIISVTSFPQYAKQNRGNTFCWTTNVEEYLHRHRLMNENSFEVTIYSTKSETWMAFK